MGDIQISELPETSLAANRHFIAIDDGTTTHKISVQNFNATGAASAAQSAAAAAQSASAAAASRTAAEQAEDDTQALITSAQTIVSSAQTYANEASTSAGTASTAANTATAQAAIATSAATDAGTYARNVNSFAIEAESYAVGGTGTRYNEDTDNSKYYSQQAHTSEINAATSETNAATSEANAAASADMASDFQYDAHHSMMEAAVSASSASSSATTASDSATTAVQKAMQAANSAHYATESEGAALVSRQDSEAWAWGKIEGVDVSPSHPAYHNNAKYYADQASGGVSGVSSFNARTGNVTPQWGDYSADIVEFDNSSNGFTAGTTQRAIEEVQDNVDTLDGSLKAVAKSGSYTDLTNKPTLGTAAAKDSTNAVTSGSSDLIESGAVYSAVNTLTNNLNNLDNAAMKTADYDSDSTVKNAGGIADYVEGELSALPYTNPNLLDNPWFTVNQRGATSVTTTWTHFADRWRTGDNAYNLVINNDKTITFKAGGITEINQAIEYDRFNLGKVYTLSVMLSNGTICSVSGVIERKSQWTRLFAVKLSDTDDIWASIDVDQVQVSASIYVNVNLVADLTVKAVKLELGSVSTLAQDTAPNYETELLKCQRYYFKTKVKSGAQYQTSYIARAGDANYLYGVQFPVEMRTEPTISNIIAKDFFNAGSAIDSGITAGATQQGIAYFEKQAGFNATYSYYMQFEASADL